jgi:hypothetical protein
MKRIILALSALAVIASVSACGNSKGSTFSDGQAFGSHATAQQVENDNPYARYPNIAVASFAPTFCAQQDPTPGSGSADDPSTLNIGTPWFQGCVIGVRSNAVKLGTTS